MVRKSRIARFSVTAYVYDGPDILMEFDGTGGFLARYAHGDRTDQPLAMTRGGQSYYIQADHQGSVIRVTDGAGAVVNSYEYDAYGQRLAATEGVEIAFGYTGREYDAESGLMFYRARTYDPATGRFLQTDPLGFAAGDANLYRYVGNNPVRWVDPFGLTIESNAQFFTDWALGWGPRNRYYGPNDLETQEMAQGAGAEGLRDEFFNNGCKNVDRFGYRTFEAYADTVYLPHTTPFQVGGFDFATATDNGDGTVTFTIPNTAGANSFFLHLPPNRKSPTGPMSNIYQTFQWTEPIDSSRGCDCG